MGTLSSYISYLWKARGRHGTHSPFVYAFVEAVLRDKRNFYCAAFIKEECAARGLDKSTGLFLFRAVHFLEPSSVVLLGDAGGYDNIVKAADSRRTVSCSPASSLSSTEEGALIIAGMSDITPALLDRILGTSRSFSAILLQPHQQELLWQQAAGRSQVLLSMDCWKAGILLRREAFRVKQHFLLR